MMPAILSNVIRYINATVAHKPLMMGAGRVDGVNEDRSDGGYHTSMITI